VAATLVHYINVAYNRHGMGAMLDAEQRAELDEAIKEMTIADDTIAQLVRKNIVLEKRITERTVELEKRMLHYVATFDGRLSRLTGSEK
jgi:hypothetical protein